MDTRERTLAGRYRLEEVVGRGGMSTVYRATDQVLGRTVAVKVLLAALADQDPTYAARFEREARAAAALATPVVATVYDTGTDDQGGQYIVMEYVPGRSLAELLADGRPVAVREAVRVAERVAEALGAAHAAGILHRDIKPANVMVADDGSVKVLDFGIARNLDGTTLTQAASLVGTAAYMAPERALGQPGDARADIYSLGCLLYAMLTGRPPFSGEVAAAVLHQQVNSEPTPPSRLAAGIPPALDALVVQMLAKAPEARPQSAGRVRDRLLALAGPSAVAGPGAAAAAAAATTPVDPSLARTARIDRTGPTSVLARRRPAGVFATAMADHRWRAVVMGLATALVALVALALLAGGGGSPRTTSTGGAKAPVRATTTRHAGTTGATTPAPAKTPKPAAPKPADHGPGKAKGAPAPSDHPGPGHDHHGGPPGQGGQGGGDGHGGGQGGGD